MTHTGFWIAAFGIDGEFVGKDRWEFEKLSAKWLSICREFLAQHGDSFDASWSNALAHIQTKFTADMGVALATFSAHGRPVVSVVLASGLSPVAESSVLKMFINSLQGVELVGAAVRSQNAFHELLCLPERPAMIVVPWADPEVSEQDEALVRELSLHTAGAYFLSCLQAR